MLLAAPFVYWDAWRAGAQRREFLRRWPGKRGILVYSNSPNWQAYVEEHWLPRLDGALVVLNWSERATWDTRHPFEASVFRRYANDREYNPLAIIFTPHTGGDLLKRWARSLGEADLAGILVPTVHNREVIRFWKAFRDYKHGKTHTLERLEAQMFDALSKPVP